MFWFLFLMYFYLAYKKRRATLLDFRFLKNNLKIDKKFDKKIYSYKLKKFIIKKLKKNEI